MLEILLNVNYWISIQCQDISNRCKNVYIYSTYALTKRCCVEFGALTHTPHGTSGQSMCQPSCTFTSLSVPWAESTIKIHWYLQGSFFICPFPASNDLIFQCDRKRTELNHYWHTQYFLLEITSHQNISNICTEMPLWSWICSLPFLLHWISIHTSLTVAQKIIF